MKFALLLAAGLVAAGPALAQGRAPAPDPAPVRSTPFPDVPRGHWAYDAVEQMRQRGILRGYPPERKPAAPKRPVAKKRSLARR